MESSLNARDRVGIQDFVLLDAHTSESAFLDNLRKRFHENLIYVSVPGFSGTGGPRAAEAAAPALRFCRSPLVIHRDENRWFEGHDFLFFSADLHRDSFGVSESIQGVGYLQQEANGYLHGCKLL